MNSHPLVDAGATAIATLVLLLVAGLPLASCLRGQLKAWRWLLAPAIGFGLISSVSYTMGWLEIGTSSFAWPLFSVLMGLAGATIARDWAGSGRPSKELWGVLLLTVFSVATCLLVLTRLGYVTTVGMTIDAISHTARAEMLADSGLAPPELQPFRPLFEWAAAPMSLDFRMGDAYLLSLISELTGLRPHLTFTPLLAMVLALTVPGVFLLARLVFGCSTPAALAAGALAATSHLLAWAVYDTFLSQVIGTFVLATLLVLTAAATREWDLRATLLAGLTLSGLFSAYPAYGAYALVVLGLQALAAAASDRGKKEWTTRVVMPPLRALAVLVVTFATNPIAMLRAEGELRLISGADRGGNIHVFPHLGEIFGLVCHPLAAFTKKYAGAMLFESVATAALAGIAAYGLWALRRSPAIFSSLALLLPAIALTVQQRFAEAANASAYGYFKSLSPLLLALLPLLARGFYELSGSPEGGGARRLGRRVAATLTFVALVGVNLLTSHQSRDYVVEHAIALDKSTLEAAAAVRELSVPRLVLGVTGVRAYWLGYLLRDLDLHYLAYPGHYTVLGAGGVGFAAAHALVEVGRDAQGIQSGPALAAARWRAESSSEVIWSNEGFELRKSQDSLIELDLDTRRFCTGTDLEAITFTWRQDRLSLTGTSDEVQLPLPRPALELTLRSSWSGDEPLGLNLGDAGTVSIPPGAAVVRMPLAGSQGQVVLREDLAGELCVEGLAVATERAQANLQGRAVAEVTSPTGAALQVSTTSLGTTITARVRLVLSGAADLAHLRVGLHVPHVDSAVGHFGVWSIDVPPGASSHHLSFDLDLGSKAARGTLDGVETIPTPAAVDLVAGNFVAALALWDLSRTEAPLVVEPLFSFSRQGDEVTVLELHPETRRAFSW